MSDRGATLVELLIALALMGTLTAGVAGVFAIAARSSAFARHSTSMTLLAIQKMEQLRALAWDFDSTGATAPLSDLAVSPPDTLDRDVAGFVDYLDGAGRSLGSGGVTPPAAVYVRRWRVLAGPVADTLTLDVVVTTLAHARALATGGPTRPVWPVAALRAIKTRHPRS